MNPSTAMATSVIDELVRNDVTDIVVCPGSRSTALAIAAVRHDGLTVHVRLDERSAGFLALGLARGSGRAVAVVTTSGTAVANLAPAVAEADMAGVALLVVSADRPIELHGVGANQTYDQARLFDGLVRWSVDLPAASGADGEPTMWRSTVARAVAVAQGTGGGQLGQTGVGGAAGPVHCNIAFREPTIPGLDDGRVRTQPYPHAVDGRPDGAPWTTHVAAVADLRGVVQHLCTMLDGARVVVLAGDVSSAIPGLERLPWPVIAEPTAGTHIGVGLAHGSLLLASVGWRRAHRPDVVLRLGHPTLSRAALVGLADIPTIQVTASGSVDPGRSAVTAITASPATVVAGLLDAVGGSGVPGRGTQAGGAGAGGAGAAGAGAGGAGVQSRHRESGQEVDVADGWMEEWRRASDVAAAVVARHLDGVDAPEPAVARRVVAAAGQRPLVVASSLPIRDVADFAGAGEAHGRVHANRGLAGIDGFISTAVGVALASGPTVALAGDLSFLHDHNGLLVEDPSAVDLDLVVVDNDGGGLFHHVPAVQVPEFERVFATPHGRDLEAVARAAGAETITAGVDDVAGLVARPPGGLRVVIVRTDRHSGAKARRSIRRELGAALAALGA